MSSPRERIRWRTDDVVDRLCKERKIDINKMSNFELGRIRYEAEGIARLELGFPRYDQVKFGEQYYETAGAVESPWPWVTKKKTMIHHVLDLFGVREK